MSLDTRTIEQNGRKYLIEIEVDTDQEPPWQNEDGHGVVSEWTSRAKRPGERVLNKDRSSARYYDVQASMEIARRDGWGTPKFIVDVYECINGKPMTKRQQAAAAVEADYQRLRAWCDDEWHYIGVIVTPLTDEGDELRSQSQSLWGIESDCGQQYIDEVVADLISQIEPEPAVVAAVQDQERQLATMEAIGKYRITLEDVRQWLESGGEIDGVHYDSDSIVGSINAVLDN